MRVIVHAGIHRTGSTNLQRFLAANRDALAAQGVSYPGDEPNHQSFAWGVLSGRAGEAEARALIAPAHAAGAAIVVLSAEDFALHEDFGWLRALAADAEVRAVIYLRRQDDWLNSWYNQHVKWPFNRAKSRQSAADFIAGFEEFPWIDYDALLSRWAAALGPDAVAPAVVERGAVEDVTADFCARAGIDMTGLARAEDRSNDSLPAHVLDFARQLELYDLKPGMRMRVIEALRHGFGQQGGGAGTVLSPEMRNRVLDRFEASNCAVARRWFGREALFAAPRPGPDAPWAPPLAVDQATLMRDWVAPLVRELVKRR